MTRQSDHIACSRDRRSATINMFQNIIINNNSQQQQLTTHLHARIATSDVATRAKPRTTRRRVPALARAIRQTRLLRLLVLPRHRRVGMTVARILATAGTSQRTIVAPRAYQTFI
jgi:hypothetical protein